MKKQNLTWADIEHKYPYHTYEDGSDYTVLERRAQLLCRERYGTIMNSVVGAMVETETSALLSKKERGRKQTVMFVNGPKGDRVEEVTLFEMMRKMEHT